MSCFFVRRATFVVLCFQISRISERATHAAVLAADRQQQRTRHLPALYAYGLARVFSCFQVRSFVLTFRCTLVAVVDRQWGGCQYVTSWVDVTKAMGIPEPSTHLVRRHYLTHLWPFELYASVAFCCGLLLSLTLTPHHTTHHPLCKKNNAGTRRVCRRCRCALRICLRTCRRVFCRAISAKDSII